MSTYPMGKKQQLSVNIKRTNSIHKLLPLYACIAQWMICSLHVIAPMFNMLIARMLLNAQYAHCMYAAQCSTCSLHICCSMLNMLIARMLLNAQYAHCTYAAKCSICSLHVCCSMFNMLIACTLLDV